MPAPSSVTKHVNKSMQVFLVLWAEPMGENNTMVTTQAKADSRFGEAIHSKVRRFVVVREGNNYCTAL